MDKQSTSLCANKETVKVWTHNLRRHVQIKKQSKYGHIIYVVMCKCETAKLKVYHLYRHVRSLSTQTKR